MKQAVEKKIRPPGSPADGRTPADMPPALPRDAGCACRPTVTAGATLAVVAPASPLPRKSAADLSSYLEGRGFTVRFGRHALRQERYLAGSDAERAADLMSAFLDPSVDAVLAARGGYGSPRLLDRLDYGAIAAHPKPFIGFSDNTALQLALLARAGLVTYSGANLFPDLQADQAVKGAAEALWTLLAGEPLSFTDLRCSRSGICEGRILGGCLSLVASLAGTPYFPDPTGAILVLEDVNEEPFRIDRMLNQLRLAGVFALAGGVVLGRFSRCTARNPDDGAVEDVLSELPDWVSGPVAAELDYGHIPRRLPLAIGGRARLDATGTRATLTVY